MPNLAILEGNYFTCNGCNDEQALMGISFKKLARKTKRIGKRVSRKTGLSKTSGMLKRSGRRIGQKALGKKLYRITSTYANPLALMRKAERFAKRKTKGFAKDLVAKAVKGKSTDFLKRQKNSIINSVALSTSALAIPAINSAFPGYGLKLTPVVSVASREGARVALNNTIKAGEKSLRKKVKKTTPTKTPKKMSFAKIARRMKKRSIAPKAEKAPMYTRRPVTPVLTKRAQTIVTPKPATNAKKPANNILKFAVPAVAVASLLL